MFFCFYNLHFNYQLHSQKKGLRMKNDLLHQYLVFNDWVDGILDEIAHNDSVSLLEFHLTFNHIETMREQANDAFFKANEAFDDENF